MFRRVYRSNPDSPIKYQYRGFCIELPANHLLPKYQERHPRYDRFLPHLAKYIGHLDTVVDIGANVGDTLAGMVEQNPAASYICIEADDIFFRHLDENVNRIKAAIVDLQVRTINAFVGKSISNVSLAGSGGTKHAVADGAGNIKSMPLDEILSVVEGINIRILKSDVDGFDYDVLDSSMVVIEEHKPLIFFECQNDYEYQKTGFARTVSALEARGYCDWIVFDNFGEVIIRTSEVALITQLMNYVWRQNCELATRTIYYYDILAVQKEDSALIDKVIKDYY